MIDFLFQDAELQRLEAENRRLRAALEDERKRHKESLEALGKAQETAARRKPGKARKGAAANGQAQEPGSPWWIKGGQVYGAADKPGIPKRLS